MQGVYKTMEVKEMKKIFLKAVMVIFVFAGLWTRCSLDREIILLPDQRFNGKFYNNADYYYQPLLIFVFDGTNRAKRREIYITPDNRISDFLVDIEIQVSNGKWRYRDWNDKANDEAKWTGWLDYSFSDDGTIFTHRGWIIGTVIAYHNDGTIRSITREKYYVDVCLIKM